MAKKKTTKRPKSYYQKVVDKIRKDLLSNVKGMQSESTSDEEHASYDETISKIKAAKTIGALSNVAQEMAWDYESFIGLLLDSLGGKEPVDSAMFDAFGWDT
jgi:hypothetical protein